VQNEFGQIIVLKDNLTALMREMATEASIYIISAQSNKVVECADWYCIPSKIVYVFCGKARSSLGICISFTPLHTTFEGACSSHIIEL
jgi:hypothetical protein